MKTTLTKNWRSTTSPYPRPITSTKPNLSSDVDLSLTTTPDPTSPCVNTFHSIQSAHTLPCPAPSSPSLLALFSPIRSMALVPRPVVCELKSQTPPLQKAEAVSVPNYNNKVRVAVEGNEYNGKIVLQPRMCTLRSFASDPVGVIKTSSVAAGDNDDEVSTFFATLSDYIESSKKSQDFEIISGRLAMIVFAATVTTEVVTGNSLFRKMELEGIAEAAGVCLGAVTCAAIFAYFSSARRRVGRIFTLGCNTLIDSLINQIVDGLFYDTDHNDWTDEI
nr:stress enhanced protein 2, chloroplastic [Ipomoea batatas]